MLELKSAILEAWESLDQNYIKDLYKSLQRKIIEVVQRKKQSIIKTRKTMQFYLIFIFLLFYIKSVLSFCLL